MSEPPTDDRFATREQEIQHYMDMAEEIGKPWTERERRDFAETVVELKEKENGADSA